MEKRKFKEEEEDSLMVSKSQKLTTHTIHGEVILSLVIHHGVEAKVFDVSDCIQFRLISRFIKRTIDESKAKYQSTQLSLNDAVFFALTRKKLAVDENDSFKEFRYNYKMKVKTVFGSPFSNLVFISTHDNCLYVMQSLNHKPELLIDLRSVHLNVDEEDSQFYENLDWNIQYNVYSKNWFLWLNTDHGFDEEFNDAQRFREDSWILNEATMKLQFFQLIRYVLACKSLLKYKGDKASFNEITGILVPDIGIWANNRHIFIVIFDEKEENDTFINIIDTTKEIASTKEYRTCLKIGLLPKPLKPNLYNLNVIADVPAIVTFSGFLCFKVYSQSSRMTIVKIDQDKTNVYKLESVSHKLQFFCKSYLRIRIVESTLPNGKPFIIVIRILVLNPTTSALAFEPDIISMIYIWDSFTESITTFEKKNINIYPKFTAILDYNTSNPIVDLVDEDGLHTFYLTIDDEEFDISKKQIKYSLSEKQRPLWKNNIIQNPFSLIQSKLPFVTTITPKGFIQYDKSEELSLQLYPFLPKKLNHQ